MSGAYQTTLREVYERVGWRQSSSCPCFLSPSEQELLQAQEASRSASRGSRKRDRFKNLFKRGGSSSGSAGTAANTAGLFEAAGTEIHEMDAHGTEISELGGSCIHELSSGHQHTH
ncbi:hypothetical protein I317_00522 [Kwoniella heveanensis CBS 569]|uniref:Uncharacterized protein n=1 Tax=Kwoniella heveanensis BCC8398 TaxID=1296120 RepID=A0A1B9GYC2_9TREE|nr:hypothetical protein I316_02495 [Kwoniella heveanensis BCC8398]OCF45620.1 hypothetical protein I317_00522 [Kwoniella heveanensis CBS 569]